MKKHVFKANANGGKAKLISSIDTTTLEERKKELRKELNETAKRIFEADDGIKMKAFMTKTEVPKEVADRDTLLRAKLKTLKAALDAETDKDKLESVNLNELLWKQMKAEYQKDPDFYETAKKEFGED